jgi:hypothetical protein
VKQVRRQPFHWLPQFFFNELRKKKRSAWDVTCTYNTYSKRCVCVCVCVSD